MVLEDCLNAIIKFFNNFFVISKLILFSFKKKLIINFCNDDQFNLIYLEFDTL